MRKIIKSVWLVLALLLGVSMVLAACGNKGALYMPKPTSADTEKDPIKKKSKASDGTE